MNRIKISILVPVYNSADCVHAFNEAVQKAFSAFDSYELILVNDKSTDKSWDKIQEVCQLNNKAIGISLRKNFGQDGALLAGLHMANGDYIVIMDDDLQHAPADVFKLYEQCQKGYDVCYALFTEKKQYRWKNLGSKLNGKLSEKFLNKPKEIYLSPFKILKREIADEIIKYPGSYPYIDATILTITANLTQVEVEHHKRFQGNGSYSFLRSFILFINHATNYSIYPLRLITLTGVAIAIVSFMLGLYYLIQYLAGHTERVEGWITLVILVIFFGGIILVSLGLIGEYIGRIFMSVNKKPQFTIDKIIKKPETLI